MTFLITSATFLTCRLSATEARSIRRRAAGEIMAAAFKAEGHELPLLVGPKMPHKYDPASLAEIMKRMAAAAEKGRDMHAATVSLQTRTLRYNRMKWVMLTALEEHWKDSRVDAQVIDDMHLTIKTKNAAGLSIHWPTADSTQRDIEVRIDDQVLKVAYKTFADHKASFIRTNNAWQIGDVWDFATPNSLILHKRHALQGPIDDAFLDPFLFVIPTGQCRSPAVQKWVEFEMHHQMERWSEVFRGDVRTKKDTEVTDDDIQKYHLVLWGDETSNQIIKRIADKLPIKRAGDSLTIAKEKFDAATHVPVLIYPNPLNFTKYVVVNSGPTFREEDDRTNSRQNPRLPDWAIIDITVPPDAESPGKIEDAGFFNEQWQWQPHAAAK